MKREAPLQGPPRDSGMEGGGGLGSVQQRSRKRPKVVRETRASNATSNVRDSRRASGISPLPRAITAIPLLSCTNLPLSRLRFPDAVERKSRQINSFPCADHEFQIVLGGHPGDASLKPGICGDTEPLRFKIPV